MGPGGKKDPVFTLRGGSSGTGSRSPAHRVNLLNQMPKEEDKEAAYNFPLPASFPVQLAGPKDVFPELKQADSRCCLCKDELVDIQDYPSMTLSCGHIVHNFCAGMKDSNQQHVHDKCKFCNFPVTEGDRETACRFLTPVKL
eukprot:TRINITY_DN1423_c0_g2_i6.p2 TRINITY_DN1423_c0_g2~~TRINITY_DN1423_c0_g2_i6.p2  ORF type:complete len:142 (-),score=11.15 TRINITY_DN1423_c0_g2_i6:711-1136(-)